MDPVIDELFPENPITGPKEDEDENNKEDDVPDGQTGVEAEEEGDWEWEYYESGEEEQEEEEATGADEDLSEENDKTEAIVAAQRKQEEDAR